MQNDECRVSVIIPFYNAEETIARAIQSALRQTVLGLEIVCVDDGSCDSSVEIVEELRKEHPQIKILRQERKGAGLARNLAIENARGVFIAFLDADDEYVDREGLQKMTDACLKHDALICGSNRIVKENGVEKDAELFAGFTIPMKGCFLRFVDYQRDYDYQSFIFRRSFLMERHIVFPHYMRYQDPPFFLRAMSEAREFYVLPDILYRYQFDFAGRNVIDKYLDHILSGILESMNYAKDNGYDLLFDRIRGRVSGEYRGSILRNLSNKVISLLLEIDQTSRAFDGAQVEILSYIYESAFFRYERDDSDVFIKKIAKVKQSQTGFGEYFHKQQLQNVAVYGLGRFGKLLIRELLANGVCIKYGIDREVREYADMEVLMPDQEIRGCDAIIVSLLRPDAVARELKKKTKVRIMTFQEIVENIIGEIEATVEASEEKIQV